MGSRDALEPAGADATSRAGAIARTSTRTVGSGGVNGRVIALHIAPERYAPMVEVAEVRAHAGRGLEGDRYFDYARRLSRDARRACAVTLIENEALEALEREFGIALAPGECRRNVLTRGIRLNALVGREFRIGDVIARGLLLCEPCRHLEKLTGRELIRGLLHRGGLRAEIVRGGVITPGDPVVETPERRGSAPDCVSTVHR